MIGIVLGVLIGLILLVCIEADVRIGYVVEVGGIEKFFLSKKRAEKWRRKMQTKLIELYESMGLAEEELARLKADMKSEGEQAMTATEALEREGIYFPDYAEKEEQVVYGRIGREMNMALQDDIIERERNHDIR